MFKYTAETQRSERKSVNMLQQQNEQRGFYTYNVGTHRAQITTTNIRLRHTDMRGI